MRSELVRPRLPENLGNLRKEEDAIRTQALLQIDGDADLREHLDIIHDSLDAIFALTAYHANATEEELVIQRLGIRLFNSGACALSLLLSGYYQNSALLIRDLLETGFLLDYFRSNRTEIKVWRDATDQKRQERFRPAKIREALDKRDGFNEKRRGTAYKLLSNYASHPTNPGFRLFSPNWMSKIGPFHDAAYVKAMLQELAKQLPAAAETYVRCFETVASAIGAAREVFLRKLRRWVARYFRQMNRHSSEAK